MIKRLKELWKQGVVGASVVTKEHDIGLAVAALMTEIMRMDGELAAAEKRQIIMKLQQRFALDDQAVLELVRRAEKISAEALDLHQFTSVVVKGFATQERVHILSELWQVAMADGHVDPYEEQLIRRIAELLGLHHSQFITAKLMAGA
ncbi:MAG: TerB family tellurite resistance protein [Mariprofundus sp.]|nr:TerB family tellurite resistance protein [Mariprofundus sp.]